MSDHRFRFRSPERDRESDERRFGLIRTVVRSAVADAEAEAKGLRARIAEARRSAIFLVEHVDYGDYAPTSRAALKTREEHLLAIERRLAQLEDDLGYSKIGEAGRSHRGSITRGCPEAPLVPSHMICAG
jgi:hypothetical protein